MGLCKTCKQYFSSECFNNYCSNCFIDSGEKIGKKYQHIANQIFSLAMKIRTKKSIDLNYSTFFKEFCVVQKLGFNILTESQFKIIKPQLVELSADEIRAHIRGFRDDFPLTAKQGMELLLACFEKLDADKSHKVENEYLYHKYIHSILSHVIDVWNIEYLSLTNNNIKSTIECYYKLSYPLPVSFDELYSRNWGIFMKTPKNDGCFNYTVGHCCICLDEITNKNTYVECCQCHKYHHLALRSNSPVANLNVRAGCL